MLPGTKLLGKYRIEDVVGRGGMGVVYKAEDIKLERTVALKFLPAELTVSPEAKERFVREAKAAAALSHPHICTIHEIGEEDNRSFIVMEYIEGQSLRQKILQGPLAQAEALEIAIQVAEGLGEAHKKGIIYRDVKPGNIMLTKKGQAKIMDFGLAKIRGTTLITREAKVMGTVAYMSPEQASGEAVDHRTDIWSLGVVLYEMLTGRLPFKGDFEQSLIYSILKKGPEPITKLRSDLPKELDNVVVTALAKNPADRYQSLEELLADLKAVAEGLKPLRAKPRLLRTRIPRWAWLAAAGLAVVAVAVFIALRITRRPPPAIDLIAGRLTFDPGVTDTAAISSDGKLIAYASDRSGEGNLDIYVQYITGGQPNRLTRHEADDYEPKFSPDGSQIVFRSEREGGGLYTIETLGGTPEKKLISGGRSPSFSPDGSMVAYIDDSPSGFPPVQKIHLVSSKSGQSKPFQPDFGVTANFYRPNLTWSEDGKHLAFSGLRAGTPAASDWWIAPLDGSPPVATGAVAHLSLPNIPQLQLAGWYGKYMYFFRGSTVEGVHLFRAPLDRGSWKISGPAQRLTSGGGVHANLSVASNGQIVFSILNMVNDFVSLPLLPDGSPASQTLTKITSDATQKSSLSVSRDGSTVAYATFVSFETGRLEIRIRSLATGRETVYTSKNLWISPYPQLSPDGSMLAYTEQIEGKAVTFVGPPQSLPGQQVCEDGQILDFFSDSQEALIRYGARRLVRQNLSTGAQTELLSVASGGVLDARLSSDDRWFTFVLAAPDLPIETYIAPVGEASAPRETWLLIPIDRSYVNIYQNLISLALRTQRQFSPGWAPDGNQLYYLSDRDGRTCIWAQRLDSKTKRPQGAPYALYHIHRTETSPASWGGRMFLAVARDKLIVPEYVVNSNIWTAKVDADR
jgi:Tol biopolymer transport system component/predicted Ser/Thr protein kinase